MSQPTRWLILILCAGVLAACSLPTAMPAPEPAAAATATVQPTATFASPTATPLPRLDEAALRNGTYDLPLFGKRILLKEGNYEQGDGADRMTAVMLPQIAWGDLDGDGREDAAVLIGENGGGSGTFVSLYVILNRDGQAVQSGAVLIDDRPRIHSLAIENGEILVDAWIHASDDVMAVPTLAVIETYRYEAEGISLVRFASGMIDGARHSIQIEAPAPGAEVTAAVNLRGSMPIGPFENNLRVRIVDPKGNVLFVGPFAVLAEDLGAPATFDQPLDLSMVPAGSHAVIELAEISMKDGSIMAMDTVRVLRIGE